MPNSLITHAARIRLTAWYLIIIALISISFSYVIYRSVIGDLQRGFAVAEYRVQSQIGYSSVKQEALEMLASEFELVRHAIMLRLLLINAGIIAVAGVSGYFLSGKTFAPIEAMIDEQKRFVADASHELRTPLTALKTEIEVAIRSKKITVREARALLKSNLEEVDKIQSLANHLLALSRYENNQVRDRFKKVALSALIDKAVTKLIPLARSKNIIIKKELAELELIGDEVSLEELLTILIDNAVKYSLEGSSINIKTLKVKREAKIVIQDFGVGIKSSDMPYIFNRFYRADTSRSKLAVDGHGLGLSIAKKITDLHNGTIEVKSAPGKGSTFSVTLPLK